MTRYVIFKCDDLLDLTDNVLAFDKIVSEKNIKATWGVIGWSLINPSKQYIDWVKERNSGGQYEFWNHGFWHGHLHPKNPYDFQNHSILYQYRTIQRTQKAAKQVFGFTLHCFGAPANKIDYRTAIALMFCHSIKAWFYGYKFSGKDIFVRTVDIEFPAGGNVDFEKFKNAYIKWGKKHDLITYQLHPNKWEDKDFKEFEKIVDFLKSENIEFLLPKDIYNNTKKNTI